MSNSNTQPPVAAFFVNTDPIKWPVTVRLPVDGGKFVDFEFTGHFVRVSDVEWAALDADSELSKLPETATHAERDAATARDNLRTIPALMVGWEDVRRSAAPDSESVPFSVEALKGQLSGANARPLAAGIWRALQEMKFGLRLGNSAPLPAPGPGDASAAEEPQAL